MILAGDSHLEPNPADRRPEALSGRQAGLVQAVKAMDYVIPQLIEEGEFEIAIMLIELFREKIGNIFPVRLRDGSGGTELLLSLRQHTDSIEQALHGQDDLIRRVQQLLRELQ